ncbi:MAG: hypothetical protein NC228_08005, partial [[Eubacterium] siraeum]|nr:hypothetical protein [[Eubacterium] siraeum]
MIDMGSELVMPFYRLCCDYGFGAWADGFPDFAGFGYRRKRSKRSENGGKNAVSLVLTEADGLGAFNQAAYCSILDALSSEKIGGAPMYSAYSGYSAYSAGSRVSRFGAAGEGVGENAYEAFSRELPRNSDEGIPPGFRENLGRSFAESIFTGFGKRTSTDFGERETADFNKGASGYISENISEKALPFLWRLASKSVGEGLTEDYIFDGGQGDLASGYAKTAKSFLQAEGGLMKAVGYPYADFAALDGKTDVAGVFAERLGKYPKLPQNNGVQNAAGLLRRSCVLADID